MFNTSPKPQFPGRPLTPVKDAEPEKFAHVYSEPVQSPRTKEATATNDIFAVASEAVTQMFVWAKADITPIEASMWSIEIGRLGPQALLSFAQYWMRGGGQQGSFSKRPNIDDFLLKADPIYVNSVNALSKLVEYVKDGSPYVDPMVDEPMLRLAVSKMGGWAAVCSSMPEPSSTRPEVISQYKQFTEKFRTAWAESEAAMIQKKIDPPPLLGLASDPNQLKIAIGANPKNQAIGFDKNPMDAEEPSSHIDASAPNSY